LKVGAGPLIFMGIIAPFAFPLVFGSEWTRAGVILTWMTPLFLLQFLHAPLSLSLHVTGNQITAMLLQTFGFILRVGIVILASAVARPYMVESYTFAGMIFYATYIAVALRKIQQATPIDDR